MKTMNYLLMTGLCLVALSCDYYDSFDNGPSTEKVAFYWEIDFHQQALTVEQFQLREELRNIEEQQENGNHENQALMEQIQIRLAVIEENLALNNHLAEEFRGIPGAGFPPSCDPRELRPCPMPIGALDLLNIRVEEFEFEKSGIYCLDRNGEIVGQMVDMEPISETGGQFARAIMDYDVERVASVRISKLNAIGEIETREQPIE